MEEEVSQQISQKMAMKYTEILDSGASKWYLVPYAPVPNVNAHAPKVCVGAATGQPQESEASC